MSSEWPKGKRGRWDQAQVDGGESMREQGYQDGNPFSNLTGAEGRTDSICIALLSMLTSSLEDEASSMSKTEILMFLKVHLMEDCAFERFYRYVQQKGWGHHQPKSVPLKVLRWYMREERMGQLDEQQGKASLHSDEVERFLASHACDKAACNRMWKASEAVQMEVLKTFEPPDADRNVSPLLMAFIRKVGRDVDGDALSCRAESAGGDG